MGKLGEGTERKRRNKEREEKEITKRKGGKIRAEKKIKLNSETIEMEESGETWKTDVSSC